MLTLIRGMPGVGGASPTPATIEALACAYVHHRLRRPPPFGWKPAEPPAVLSDLSSYAETLRVSRLVPGIPAYCGTAPQRELERKGAKDAPEHSHAFPLHLAVLLGTEVPRDARLRKARSFLLIMSFFGLRTGIVFGINRLMFVAWLGGFVFLWRFATKRQGGDQTKHGDTLPHTRKVHYSGARHQWLDEFLGAAPAGPLFDDVTYEDLNEFIRTFVPGAPVAFDIRTYGVRVAADTEAVELGCPKRVINMVFDWKPEKKTMRSHYSGNNVLLMYKLSEERANHLEVAPFAPGLYAIVYRGASLPTWDLPTVPDDAPPLPQLDPATVDAAWNCAAPLRRPAARRARAPVASGAGEASAPREPSPTLSVDCAQCSTHVSRQEVAAMCEVPTCAWGKCLDCFPDMSLELWCPKHRRTAL
jgi:hypothetical protein